MKKKIVMALMATVIATSTLGTGFTVQAAEAPAATTSNVDAGVKKTIAKQNLNKDVIAKVFDAKYYATAYPDVTAVVGNDANKLLAHYMNFGIYEGRDASETFNASIYATANPDLLAAYGENLEGLVEHFVNFGINEKRVATIDAYNALDSQTQAKIVAQTGSYLNENGSSFEAYAITPSKTNASYSDKLGTGVVSVYNPHGFANYEEAYAYYSQVEARDEDAKWEAYRTQKQWYNPETGEVHPYGEIVYGEIDEYGIQSFEGTTGAGIGITGFRATDEQINIMMTNKGFVKGDDGVWYQTESSNSSSDGGSSDSGSSSSSSSDSGSSSGSSAGDWEAEGFSWDD